MPNNAGLILYAPCVLSRVFTDEFRVEMVDCLGKSYWTPPVAHASPGEYGTSSWYEGRANALIVLSRETYGASDSSTPLPKLRLRMRTLHHDFGHCDDCNSIADERTQIRKLRLGPAALTANNDRAKAHADMYMGERRALESMRLSSGRGEVLFCMRDKCGDDSLYIPSRPRETLSNKGKYQWRMAAQFELYPGKLTQVNLLPAHCFAGASFGCTAMLSAWTELMDLGLWTAETRRVILNEDGGSENVNWEKHGLFMACINELKTLEEIIVPRLPPEHHHDWADTTISVLERALDAPGQAPIETLLGMQSFIQQLYSKSKSYGQSAVKVHLQLANYDFAKFLDGCVDVGFANYGKPHVWRYSRNPETGKPRAQFKMFIRDKDTFYQDEWGPWDERYVSHTNELGHIENNVRVLRSKPEGAPFMLSYPDITKDPGLQAWKLDDDWSRETVFNSLLRTWKYKDDKSTDSWSALNTFYAAHQTPDTLPAMPINLQTPKGDTITLAGMPYAGGWAKLWEKLTQFNLRRSTTSSTSLATVSSSAHQRTLAQSIAVPRASAVNVVNHIGYNAAARSHAAAGEGLEKAQLWEKLVTPSSEFNDNLFWVVLPHFEGELRVGLGTVVYSTGVKPSHTLTPLPYLATVPYHCLSG
jgi:hypothetical protein